MLKPENQPGGVAANDDYTFGRARNSTSAGARDGYPWEQDVINDPQGFFQRMVSDADITPSDVPDTVLLSDMFNALMALNLNLINGLEISNGTDADHDIDIAPGYAASKNKKGGLGLLSSITKQLDASWVVGSAVGGLFSGSIAANTTYHVFLIRKDSDGTVDAGFDTDIGAANIPAGYTAFRRVGSIVTDVSSNIIAFTQFGCFFELVTPIVDVSAAAGSTVGALVTLSAPSGLASSIKALLTMEMRSLTSAFAWVQSSFAANGAASASFMDILTGANGEFAQISKVVPVDSSGQVRYRNSAVTGGPVAIHTKGWYDERTD